MYQKKWSGCIMITNLRYGLELNYYTNLRNGPVYYDY